MSSSLGADRIVRPSPPDSTPVFGIPWLSLGCAVIFAALSVVLHLPPVFPWGAAALVAVGSAAEGTLRGRHRARALDDGFQREVAAFERDLERALAGEMDSLLSRLENDVPPLAGGSGPVVFLGRGEITSTVQISSSAAPGREATLTSPWLSGAPLLVQAAGGIRVLGPPRLARRIARGYVAQVLRREPGSRVVRGVDGSDVVQGAITVAVPRDAGTVACRFEVADMHDGARVTRVPGGARPFEPATEVWIGPDGSARARSLDQAERTWVAVDPVLGPGDFRLAPSAPDGSSRA